MTSQRRANKCVNGGQPSQELMPIMKPGPTVLNFFSCSTQLSTKFVLLINVKMPTIVGILTLIGMIIQQMRDIKQETSLFVVF